MKKLLTALLIASSVATFAQQKFEGKATYMSKRTVDMSQWGDRFKRMSEQQKSQMMARMKNFLEKTYILSFNRTESNFKEEAKLDAPGSSQGFRWAASNGQGSIYKNLQDKTMIEDVEMFSKRFLVKEPMEQPQWEMGTETKKIGNYTCYKATMVKVDNSMDWGRMFRRRNNQAKDSTNNGKEEVRTINVTAWYTPQIPVSAGPASYWGLPGLILELNEGRNTMLCTEIIINPEESIVIKEPTKGKEVTREKYNEIVKEKTEEIREQFRNRRGRGGRGF